jgi:hypothetical protein
MVPGFTASTTLSVGRQSFRSTPVDPTASGVFPQQRRARAMIVDGGDVDGGDVASATKTCTCPCCIQIKDKLYCC